MAGLGVLAVGLLLGWSWRKWFHPLPAWALALYLLLPAAHLARPLFLPGAFQIPHWGKYASTLLPFSAEIGPSGVTENELLVDVSSQIFPWYALARGELLAGRFPLYNPTVACGMPLLENAQASLFSLPLLATLWVPLVKGLTAAVFLQIFFTLIFTHAYLCSLACSERAAVFGSVSFAFSVYASAWMYFPIMRVVPYLPLMLFAIEQLRRGSRRRDSLLLALAMAQMVVAGNPESAFFCISFGLLYAGWRLPLRALIRTACAGALALLLSSFFWLPFLDYLPHSGKFNWVRTLPASIWQSPPVDPSALATYLLPLYYGLPTGSYIHPTVNFNLMAGYAGALALFFAAWSLGSRRRPPSAFFWIAGAGIAAALMNLPPVSTFLRHLPVVRYAEFGHLRVLLTFTLAALGALGMDAFLSRERPSAWPLAVFAALLFSLGLTAPAIAGAPPLFKAKLLAGAAILMAFALVVRLRRATLPLILLLVGLDLIWPLQGLNPVYPINIAPQETPAIRKAHERVGDGRFVAEGVQFMPNVNVLYGLEDVRFNDPMTPWTYYRFVKACGLIRDDYWRGWICFEGSAVDFLGVRCILKMPVWPLPGREPFYRGRDGWLYENSEALPRFFAPATVIPAPTGEGLWTALASLDLRKEALVAKIAEPLRQNGAQVVSIRAVSPTEYRVRVKATEEFILASSLPDLRPWSAETGGTLLPKMTLDGHFAGWRIPPGEHTLNVRYRHTLFKTGAGLTTLGVLLGLVYVFSRRRASSASMRTM